MIIVRFQGGLGNQMFQYAFLRSIQHMHPDLEILADLTPYRTARYHCGYELTRVFGIYLKEAPRKTVKQLSPYRPARKGCGLLYRIWRKLFPAQLNEKVVLESYKLEDFTIPFYDDFFHLDQKKDFYLEGFWCNEKYFFDIKEEILKTFSFLVELTGEKKILLKDIQTQNAVAVHIRRGDYKNTSFDIVDKIYYEKAVRYIEQHVDQAVYYIFSDDIEYARELFGFVKNKNIVEGNSGTKSYLDMFFMSKCKHQIIANSTFSYWGAYLNKYEKKIVVAPSRFSENVEWALACKNWHLI